MSFFFTLLIRDIIRLNQYNLFLLFGKVKERGRGRECLFVNYFINKMKERMNERDHEEILSIKNKKFN